MLGPGERWRVIEGDCRDVLPSIDPAEVAVVITDGPFGIEDRPLETAESRRTGQRTGRRIGRVNDWHPTSDWDAAIDPEWCREVCRVAPVVAWFGHWRKRCEVEAAMTHPLRGEIVWAKDCHVGPPCPLAMRDERIWLFASQGIRGRTFETSVWDEPIIPTWAVRHHKNEKPLGLMRRLVRFLTEPGDLILDPFCGSGTTLRAAVAEGRRAVGVDIDTGCCLTARRRLGDPDALPAPDGLFAGLEV